MKEMLQKWGTIIFVGFIFMGALMYAKGFSQAVGTVDTGVIGIGKTLEGR